MFRVPFQYSVQETATSFWGGKPLCVTKQTPDQVKGSVS